MRTYGFTLLELLLVVGVSAILIVGGISTYNLVSNGMKVNETVALLNIIVERTHKYYPNLDYGTDDIEGLLINTGSVPKKYYSATAGHIRTPFGDSTNAISVIGSAGTGDANADIDIQMRVPPALLVQILSIFNVHANGVIACGVSVSYMSSENTLPLDQVSDACGSSMTLPDTPNLIYYAR